MPPIVPMNAIELVVTLLHKAWFAGCIRPGVGFMVIVNVLGAPGQPAAVGVTVIVADTGVLVALTALNGAIFPEPLAGKPIAGLLFVHVYVVPFTDPVNDIALVGAPLQKLRFAGCTTVGVGFTVIVNVTGGPIQFAAHGVTVIVAIAGVSAVLTAANDSILPLPLAPRPIEVLSLVHR